MFPKAADLVLLDMYTQLNLNLEATTIFSSLATSIRLTKTNLPDIRLAIPKRIITVFIISMNSFSTITLYAILNEYNYTAVKSKLTGLFYHIINTINQAWMQRESNKKVRLAIQNFRLSQEREDLFPVPRENSLQPKGTLKKVGPAFMNYERRSRQLLNSEDNKIVSFKEPPDVEQHQKNSRCELPSRKILILPKHDFDSIQTNEPDDNPEEKLHAYSSVKLNRGVYHKIQKNISEKYQRKVETLRGFKMPLISQPLFTISHFTLEALNSIPKHVEIFNQKLKLIKKNLIHSSQNDRYLKRQSEPFEMPEQLRTLRMTRKSSEDRITSFSRKNHHAFRTTLLKKPKECDVNNHQDIYKIEGWGEENLQSERLIFN